MPKVPSAELLREREEAVARIPVARKGVEARVTLAIVLVQDDDVIADAGVEPDLAETNDPVLPLLLRIHDPVEKRFGGGGGATATALEVSENSCGRHALAVVFELRTVQVRLDRRKVLVRDLRIDPVELRRERQQLDDHATDRRLLREECLELGALGGSEDAGVGEKSRDEGKNGGGIHESSRMCRVEGGIN